MESLPTTRDAAPLRNYDTKPGGYVQLSARETSVLRMVAEGYCNKEIAAGMDLSTKTVETYRARAFIKLALRSRADAFRFAKAAGWSSNAASVEVVPVPDTP
ncbi:helix-turn-helix transcriptional regulator [Aureimonas sp. AU4]|uniref:response regulator transcription factor n=1 Tax=Aureimonas sp. AU4 TaxID=1638163 RepID=UPI00244EF562|nr:helix-turn-helix transcriptional regulator [Aureimonas sp. AU4]